MIIDWVYDHLQMETYQAFNGLIANMAFDVPDLGGGRIYKVDEDRFQKSRSPYSNKVDLYKKKLY